MTVDPRFALALQSCQQALARLHEALALDETPIVRDALIQRFEFTFEMAWRAMYRWLRARGIAADEAAFTVLPLAFKHRLVTDEAAWSQLRQHRNLTSHTYKEEVAIEVAAFVRDVGITKFDELLATLTARAGE